MTYVKIITIFIGLFISFNLIAFPVPKNGEVKFDIIRKNKVIGFHKINFIKNEDILKIETNIYIKVKALFIPVYTFSHQSTETWTKGNFTEIQAHTDFEDEREYFIKGKVVNNLFAASGMDGKLELNKNILPSNFWNIELLKQKEVFDTQKGIVRNIEVKDLGEEDIIINDKKIPCKKYTLDATTHPKDKGPFPKYTLWYSLNNELMKFKFKNWKDDKIVTIVRDMKEEN